MSKGSEINVEIGLCTKGMAKENPIKDFEILVEEYKDKWSKQMYDYFKECLSIIEKELKEYKQHEEILNDYGLTLANFREACLLLAMLKGSGRNIHNIDKQLKALEFIKKCFYVAKSSGAILLTDYGFEHKEELKEVLL